MLAQLPAVIALATLALFSLLPMLSWVVISVQDRRPVWGDLPFCLGLTLGGLLLTLGIARL